MAAPTLTLLDDDSQGPRVLVKFATLAAGTQTVNVQRTAEGRTMPVRGGIAMFAVDTTAVLDPEVPFGIPVSYQAEQFDVNGASLGFTDVGTITVDSTDTWVTQPLNPTIAVQVRLMLDSAATQRSPSPGSTTWTEGATVGRLISGQRTGLQQTPLRMRFRDTTAMDLFASMFGSYEDDYPSVICIRTPPTVPLPAVLFAGCLAPSRVQVGVGALLTYELTIDEVAPPAPGLVIPSLRRNDIDAAYPTRAARAAAYTTRLARDTDYSLAGLAG